MDTNDAVTTLAALAQPSRLAVFRMLVNLEPQGATPGELAERLGLPGNTLSFHLRTLLHAGLIKAQPSGRHIVYRADIDRMQGLTRFLTASCCGGDPSRCLPNAVNRPARKRVRAA